MSNDDLSKAPDCPGCHNLKKRSPIDDRYDRAWEGFDDDFKEFEDAHEESRSHIRPIIPILLIVAIGLSMLYAAFMYDTQPKAPTEIELNRQIRIELLMEQCLKYELQYKCESYVPAWRNRNVYIGN